MNHQPTPLQPDWTGACGQHLDPQVIASLLNLAGEDEPDLVLELIDLFLEDADVRILALEQATKAQEWDRVVKIAHTLKGASATIGAQPFSVACREVEIEAREGDLTPRTLKHALDSHLDTQFCLISLRAKLTGLDGITIRKTA